MGAAVPKQYLLLGEKPIILYSFELFRSIEHVKELVIVCEERYEGIFAPATEQYNQLLKFASPGKRRQDSVENGFAQLSEEIDLVLVHDGARPFITAEAIDKVLTAAEECGGAVLGSRAICTMKEVDSSGQIMRTIDRSTLWEMQTPQVLRKDWMCQGLEFHRKNGSTVTDDVALIEQFSYSIQVVEGDSFNRKITTPEDLQWAELWLAKISSDIMQNK